MAGADVIQFTDANFEQEVLKSQTPVVVDFWAEWCGPCKMLTPIIEQLATELKGKIKVGKLNTDDNPRIAQRYRIMSIPTILVIQDGELVAQRVGYMSKGDLKKAVSEATGIPL